MTAIEKLIILFLDNKIASESQSIRSARRSPALQPIINQ